MPPESQEVGGGETVDGQPPEYYPPIDPGYVQTSSAVVGTVAVGVLTAAASSPTATSASEALRTGFPELLVANISLSVLGADGGWNLLTLGILLTFISVALNWLSLYIRWKKPRWGFLMRKVRSRTRPTSSQRQKV